MWRVHCAIHSIVDSCDVRFITFIAIVIAIVIVTSITKMD